MKTKFIAGFVAITLSAALAGAAPAARAVTVEALRTQLTEYNNNIVKKLLFGKDERGQIRITSRGLAPEQMKAALDKALRNFEMAEGEKSGISNALAIGTGDARITERRMDNIASLVGARKIGESLSAKPEAREEGESIVNVSRALMKTIANSIYTRSKPSTRLTEAETKDAGLALDRLEQISESVITMNRAERDMYAAVELKRDEILQRNQLNGEEALVEAIMQVKGVSKEKAMEIVRRLKECV